QSPQRICSMADLFDDLSREMGEARESLRSFTLGRPGVTRQNGLDAINQVVDLCGQMQEGFGLGEHARVVANTVLIARNQILAAKARLAILARKKIRRVPSRGEP